MRTLRTSFGLLLGACLAACGPAPVTPPAAATAPPAVPLDPSPGAGQRALQAIPTAQERWAVQGSVGVTRRWFSFWNPTYDVRVGGAHVGVLVRTPEASAYAWLLRDRAGSNVASLVRLHPERHYHVVVRVRQGLDLGSIRQAFRHTPMGTVSEVRVLGPRLEPLLSAGPALLGGRAPVALRDGQGGVAGSLGPTTGAALELQQPLDARLVMGLLASRIEARDRLAANPLWLSAGDSSRP